MRRECLPRILAVCAALPAAAPAADVVDESARRIPVIADVDVVVAGGASAGVEAAVAAAQAGAKVFLLAPRPYLGEDLCGTMRLWLEPDEKPLTPLAEKIFARTLEPVDDTPPSLQEFTYSADLPPSAKHADTRPPSKLADGLCRTASTHSVQYDGDVVLTADLGAAKPLASAGLVLFHRPGSDFVVDRVLIRTSPDGKAWSPPVERRRSVEIESPFRVAAPCTGAVRYARFEVRRAVGATRVLVGEIELAGPPPAPGRAPAPKLASGPVTPMQVKRTLDEALLAAKVDFLYGCYPTEVLRDAAGGLCGVVVANRAGRQAVRAKAIVDATPRATVARLAGAGFAPYPAGEHVFRRLVSGGAPARGPGVEVSALPFTLRAVGKGGPRDVPVFECTLRLPMAGDTDHAWAEADQRSRDLLWHPDQLEIAETLFEVPPDALAAERPASGPWAGAETAGPGAFRPAGVPNLFVLGGCAGVSREAAERMLRPAAFMAAGAEVGRFAAAAARGRPAPEAARVADAPGAPVGGAVAAPGDVRELLSGARPTQRGLPAVDSPARRLPVLGRYDVVVVGGGTGGAPGGIGAARGGGKTLLIEYLHGLGGVGTQGRISKYYHGYRGGFTARVDEGIAALGAKNFVVGKSEWWRRANREAGTEIWFGCLGAGALVEPGADGWPARVRGVVVATPRGRGVVLANTVIDASGNSDVAAAAGAACDYTGAAEASVQGAGLPPLNLGDDYTNTDWTFADDTDLVDITHHFVIAREKYKAARDLGQLVDTRERRRIVGDVTISPMDIILGRAWPDAMNIAKSNFDTHGFTVHPLFHAMPPDREDMTAQVPLRALRPRGLDGILVTGLGISAHRDAMPVIRMQPDVQNQGYACGHAAALAAKAGTTVRGLDVRRVQAHLVEQNILPPDAVPAGDPPPVTADQLQAAVDCVMRPPPGEPEGLDGVVRDRHAAALLFDNRDRAVPLLERAHAAAAGDAKLGYAHLLALLGSRAGSDTLRARVRAAEDFDKGWTYRGLGQFGRSVSELDGYIIALGFAREPRALEVILDKLARLDAGREYSHHRACAMALEALGDPRAARPLAELLRKPGMGGHAATTVDEARRQALTATTDNSSRNDCLREIAVARALYRCGDVDGLGERALRAYAQDLRGHYARHAQAVLDAGPGRVPAP